MVRNMAGVLKRTSRPGLAALVHAGALAGRPRSEVDAPMRAALSQHWCSIVALEHASVASSARFTLHLFALGAPPTLVAEAQRAGLDEVEHAHLAYGLAGAYSERRAREARPRST